MRAFIILFFLTLIAGCSSIHRERNISDKIDIENVNLYKIKLSKLESYFPNVIGLELIYKDNYLGNFTHYYEPRILNSNLVSVPQISCYSKKLDYPENESELHSNKIRCRYYEIQRYYTEKPHYFYELEQNISKEIVKLIVLAWYQQTESNQYYVSRVFKDGNEYTLFISGESCLDSVTVIYSNEKSIQFEKNSGIQVCS